jgi:peroxiredoxin Q/BCP
MKMSQKSIEVGDSVPEFTLKDQTGTDIKISDLIGKSIFVLYFYPKDNSPGCTAQACTFRDQFADFIDNGARVIGISSDSVESHKDFINKYNLPFTLLSDNKGKVRELFGIKPSLGLIPGRITYVVDLNGKVRYMFSSQLQTKAHVEKALKVIMEIRSESAPRDHDLKINL